MQVFVGEATVKKWGKYLPVVTLLFPGGLLIVGAWLAVEFIRRGGDLAGDYRKGVADNCNRQEEGG